MVYRTIYAVCNELGCIDYQEMALPYPEEEEMIVKVNMCGVCGTDVLKVYQAGFSRPQKLGHECVGVVAAVGRGALSFFEGQRVVFAHHVPSLNSHYSMHESETVDPLFRVTNLIPGGFSEYVFLSPFHVKRTVLPIPDELPDTRAVFVEPLACCLRAIRKLRLHRGDKLLLIGVGAVGLLFIPALSAFGIQVIAADVREERLSLAKQWGAIECSFPEMEVVNTVCQANTYGRGVDAVILTVVDQKLWNIALSSVRDGGTVMLFGCKPGSSFSVDAWSVFSREIRVITSYSSSPADFSKALSVMVDHAWPLETMISHSFSLLETHLAIEMMREGKVSKAVIRNN